MSRTIDDLSRDTAATSLRIVLVDMTKLRAQLMEQMPGKMDALAEKIDVWARGIAVGLRELERPLRASSPPPAKPGEP